MTVSPQSLLISIQGLQNEPQLQDHEKIVIQILLNSAKHSLLEPAGSNSSCTISDISPNDIVQVVLMEHHKQVWLGSVSFLLDSFLECKQKKFSQWVTLFKDPRDDLFDSNFPNSDKQAPRLRLCFDFSADSSIQSEKTSDVDTVPSQIAIDNRVYFERSMSEYESSSDESAHIRILTEEGVEDNKCYTLRTDTDDKITAHLKMMKGSFKDSRHSPLSFRLPSGLVSARGNSPFMTMTRDGGIRQQFMQTQKDDLSADLDGSSISLTSNSPREVENPVTNLKKAFANEFALLSDKLKQADSLKKNAKELKEILTRRDSHGVNIGTETNREQMPHNDKEEVNALKQQNEELNVRLKEILDKLQILEEENRNLKETENSYTEKLNNVSNELEKLRIGAVNHERLFGELQNELAGVQEQAREETQLRIKLQKKNEELNEALNELKEQNCQYEAELQARNTKDTTTCTSQKELEPNDSFCFKKPHQPQQKIEDCDFVLQQESEPVTQRTLRNEEGADTETEMQLMHGASFGCLMDDPYAIEEIESISKHSEKLTHKVEPIKSREVENPSKTDKLIIDSLMSQIKHLQSYVKSLEAEKEDLKDELFRSNENYSRLTTKYIELTEILAGGVTEEPKVYPTTRRHQSIKTDRELYTPRTPKATLATLATENEDDDEVQTKLNEFLAINKILPSSFVRVDKNVYMFNDKKISLKVLHKRLIAKVNGNFQTMDEFWRTCKAKERTTKTPPPLTKLGLNAIRSQCGTPERRMSQSIALIKLGSKKAADKMGSKDKLDSARSDIPQDLFETNTQNENVKVKDVISVKLEKKRRISSSNLKERVKKI